jgi:hypothetical protein
MLKCQSRFPSIEKRLDYFAIAAWTCFEYCASQPPESLHKLSAAKSSDAADCNLGTKE